VVPETENILRGGGYPPRIAVDPIRRKEKRLMKGDHANGSFPWAKGGVKGGGGVWIDSKSTAKKRRG